MTGFIQQHAGAPAGTLAVLLGLCVALAACADHQPDATAPDPSDPSASVGDVSADPEPDPLEVAAAVPGFGGYFLDGDGAPTVYLTDPAQRPLAEEALAAFLADRGFTAEDLRVRPGDYDYAQLHAWFEAAWGAALAVDGAISADLDEGSNRLRFGGVDGTALVGMALAVAAAGVPADAVIVETRSPVEQVVTLRDRVRPVHGGYQINFFPLLLSPVSLVCTLGFNVIDEGVNSFITNSHCTNHQGGTETPTDYYQPLRGTLANPDNFIGVEVEDPHYDAVSCIDELPGAVCRYSDAARAEYAAGQAFDLGTLARAAAENTGTLEVDAANPSFRIQKETKRTVLGETAHKVGRTTGWSSGPVIATCITTIVLGTVPPIVQRCQDEVAANVAGGDSGSPVFRRSGGSSSVRLMGILWGGSVGGDNPTFVFSPLANIRLELGDFITH